jgi:hypothetical protein
MSTQHCAYAGTFGATSVKSSLRYVFQIFQSLNLSGLEFRISCFIRFLGRSLESGVWNTVSEYGVRSWL